MARRNSSTTKSTNEAVEAAQAEEATVSTTVENPAEVSEEAVEATAEATTSTEGKKAEAEIDLTAFQSAAQAAVAEADTATGEIAAQFVDPVQKEYRLLEGLKAKNAAKNWLGEQMKDQMNKDSIQGARAYLQLQEQMHAGSAAKSEKAPADPTEAFVTKEATLQLATLLTTPGEGVADDWQDRVNKLVDESRESAKTYLAWMTSDAEDKGDEPEVTAVVKNAVKLSIGKAAKVGGRSGGGSTFTGERRDIGKHITEAFASVEPGTFMTVAEIRKFRSEEYGDNPPSAGAISARLFPQSGKCTVEGIEPGTNAASNKGATKL